MENANSLFDCCYLVTHILEVEVFSYPFFTFKSWDQLSLTSISIIIGQWRRTLDSADLLVITYVVTFGNFHHLLVLDFNCKFVNNAGKDIKVVR